MTYWKLNTEPGDYLVVPYYGKRGDVLGRKVKRGYAYRTAENKVETRRPTQEEAYHYMRTALYIYRISK